LNADDEVYGSLAKINSRIISYGIKNDADLRVKKIKSDLNGSVFRVYFSSKDIEISTPLIGEHNIYNILGSIGVALSRGITLEECGDVIRNFSGVAGRLERVETNRNFGLFVDYAHTDDGLENVLKSLRPFTAGRLLLLFGCGGERDRGKRPRMAGVAEHYADFVMLTSDNPRNEDENEILKEIITGFGEGYNTYEVQSDRRKAIERIIAMAGKDDVVLLAGKGHEDYQVIGDKKVPFSDKEEAKRVLKVQKGAVDA
jgi:UDP-N-acetylmuramoyl-L-alanyl-D-glutamate--2,6-diaminopimelate ligase